MTPDWSPSRRRFLAVVGATATAGCLNGNRNPGGTPEETVTPGAEEPVLGYDTSLDHDLESWAGYDDGWEAPTDSPLSTSLTTERLVENLDVPWDLSFTDDGAVFITERVGRVRQFVDGELSTVTEPPDAIDAGTAEDGWWVDGGEGGTLGVTTHPGYPDPPLLYVYYTYEGDDGERYNKVECFDVSADDPGATSETIVEGIPGRNIHNGGRITFGPENYLWITCGDASTTGDPAQDLTSLAGSILRVTASGAPAGGNPDLGEDADPLIFTYGHRNPQGLAWLPDGTNLASEHGPSGKDELNRVVRGGNYGWPDTRDRDAYLDAEDVRRPLANSGGGTSWAPSGALFYTGGEVPAWQNRMVVGCLGSQQIRVATLTPAGGDLPPADDGERFDQDWTDPDYVATVHSTFGDDLGRVRHVEQGPDGGLYAITSNWDGRANDPFPVDADDGLVRIVPE